MEKKLTTPLRDEDIKELKSGDVVYLSGIIYTGRDAAHKRMIALIEKGEELPFNPEGQVIYYVGPSPASPGKIIGSAGPTTSYRMDSFAPLLMENGIKGMIGKGGRTEPVKRSIIKNNAVYFAAIGGAGALISKCIKNVEIIAWEDLGPEAVRKLEIENMPLVVINDSHGGDLYSEGIEKYRID